MVHALLTTASLLLAALIPTSTASDVSASAGQDALVISHLFPACNGRSLKKKKPLAVPVDRCLTTPTFALTIQQPAICPNGTTALWARFPAKGCGNGTLDETFGLTAQPVNEDAKCVDVMGIESMSFWCEGVKPKPAEDKEPEKAPENPDKTKKGTVSESVCMVGKAPFWKHTLPDTCVNLNYERIQVTHAAVCADGSLSRLSLYKGTECHGSPEIRTVPADQEGRAGCFDVHDKGSYAFYCTGEGIERGRAPSSNRRGGGLMHALLVLTVGIMLVVVGAVAAVYMWARRREGGVGELVEKFRNFFKRDDGAITL